MIKFKEFITERMSSVTYHHLTVYDLISIIESDTFVMTKMHSYSDEYKLVPKKKKFKDEMYFMSTARSLSSNFPQNSLHGDAIIKLDGEKLNHKYQSQPVDYYGSEYADKENKRVEAEDRLISNNGEIEDFNQYIKEIMVIVDPVIPHRAEILENIKQLYKLSKDYRIPIKFYAKSNRYGIVFSKKYNISYDDVIKIQTT